MGRVPAKEAGAMHSNRLTNLKKCLNGSNFQNTDNVTRDSSRNLYEYRLCAEESIFENTSTRKRIILKV